MSVADLLLSSGHIVPDSVLYAHAKEDKWVQCRFTMTESPKWEWSLIIDLVHISQFSKNEFKAKAHKLLEQWEKKHSEE